MRFGTTNHSHIGANQLGNAVGQPAEHDLGDDEQREE